MMLARLQRHNAGHPSMRRIKSAWLPTAFALLLTGACVGSVSALEFRCIEPSRYRNLLPVFNDDPNVFFSYFGLERRRLPNLESCRAMIVTGSLAPGDADVFLDRVIQGGGWLTVLYLALDGTNLEEEAKIASVVRLFSLKTRAVRHTAYRYQPDFALRWIPLVSLTATSGTPTPLQEGLSPLDRGLKDFAERRDLMLRVDPPQSVCADGCRTIWTAGVNRLFNSAPAGSPPPPSAATTDQTTARTRIALAYYLDRDRLPPADDPVLSKALDWSSVTPSATARMLRDKCNPELAVAESIEARLGAAFDTAARNNLRPAAVQSLASNFEALSRAGSRLQQCFAAAHEVERLASFQRQCATTCDKPKLSEASADAAREILDKASKL
jgi:hypothetical protein